MHTAHVVIQGSCYLLLCTYLVAYSSLHTIQYNTIHKESARFSSSHDLMPIIYTHKIYIRDTWDSHFVIVVILQCSFGQFLCFCHQLSGHPLELLPALITHPSQLHFKLLFLIMNLVKNLSNGVNALAAGHFIQLELFNLVFSSLATLAHSGTIVSLQQQFVECEKSSETAIKRQAVQNKV